jgi:hypothetical protein
LGTGWISWAPDLFFISWARLGTRFEKSDFSKKIGFLEHLGHGLKNPIFPKNRISWAPDLFIFHFLGTFGHTV